MLKFRPNDIVIYYKDLNDPNPELWVIKKANDETLQYTAYEFGDEALEKGYAWVEAEIVDQQYKLFEDKPESEDLERAA